MTQYRNELKAKKLELAICVRRRGSQPSHPSSEAAVATLVRQGTVRVGWWHTGPFVKQRQNAGIKVKLSG